MRVRLLSSTLRWGAPLTALLLPVGIAWGDDAGSRTAPAPCSAPITADRQLSVVGIGRGPDPSVALLRAREAAREELRSRFCPADPEGPACLAAMYESYEIQGRQEITESGRSVLVCVVFGLPAGSIDRVRNMERALPAQIEPMGAAEWSSLL